MNIFKRIWQAFFIRKEIMDFAEDMEITLRKNAYKEINPYGKPITWKDGPANFIWSKLYEEFGELFGAGRSKTVKEVKAETIDVANVCMFLHNRIVEGIDHD